VFSCEATATELQAVRLTILSAVAVSSRTDPIPRHAIIARAWHIGANSHVEGGVGTGADGGGREQVEMVGRAWLRRYGQVEARRARSEHAPGAELGRLWLDVDTAY